MSQNAALSNDAKIKVVQIIDKVKKSAESSEQGPEGSLIVILNEVQDELGHVPYEAQKIIAESLDIPLAQVYGVVTFYSRFSLNPVGKYKVAVCLGTACYVKGSDKVLANIEQATGVKAGLTTDDGMFTVQATRCVGACGLAPIMTINDDVYGKLNPDDVFHILDKYK